MKHSESKLNKKGFTLAELLIVVAIIGVLVAISIPIFTTQLEKSRDAVTASNVRAAYAEAQAAWLTKEGDGTHVTVDAAKNTVTVDNVAVKGQINGGVTKAVFDFPFTMGAGAEDALGIGGKDVTKTLVFTYTANSDAQPTLTVQ